MSDTPAQPTSASPMVWARRLAPVTVLAAVLAFFAFAIVKAQKPGGDPSLIPTALLDTPVPAFDLPPIQGRTERFAAADLQGKVSIVNIFASWCVACVYEHPNLVSIREAGGPPIYGLAWKDAPGATARWLERRGDPYAAIGDDADGRVAIDLGVTGAPESYVVDKQGRIRFKQVGPITKQDWEQTIAPLVAKLEAEGGA